MNPDQTITVWKSDFKDFPGLYEATMWCIGSAVQKANNFVVIRGYNPYEMLNDERFKADWRDYLRCIGLAKEYGWLEKVVERLHSMQYDSSEVFLFICGKLDYPEGHIRRQW